MVVVFPEANAVIALNSAMDESRVLLPHLRGHFPAAFAGGGTEAADEMLARRLADWRAAPPLPSLVAGECAQQAGGWPVPDPMLGISAIRPAFDRQPMGLSLTECAGRH